MISGPRGRVHDSQNQLFVTLGTPEYLKKVQEKYKTCFEKHFSGQSQML